ncbi:flavin reductase family protein [Vallitalea guaymasensis]|uniref:flavin reductase family protein n=1 Tax=Vallitalea guaymasensis TaxID=1185412 RepID=UPI002352639D|nr:flavin reductase family protein [Vallitalea guaymasensis]
MKKKQFVTKSSLQPAPKVLVSCRDKDGKDNALAVAYCGNCSYDPPMVMVGIVPSRHSYQMVKDTKCFVVNLPTKDYQKEFDYLGSVSARDEDKLAKMNIKTADASKVNAPILVDCPVNIECTVVDSIMTGSHEMFIGKIENINADENIVNEDGSIDYSKLDLI